MWKTSDDIMASIQEAHERLKSGDVPVDAAHAEARILGTAVKLLGVRLEHAKLTGRLTQGDKALPGFDL